MEKIKNFFNKHGLVAFVVLFLIMSMRGCVKNASITKLEKENKKLSVQVDSLTLLVPSEENIKLSNLKSRYSVYDELNNEMSKLNRQEQMLKFQNTFIIPQKEDLRKQISILENN
jgi:hypothetical protein